MKCCASKRCYAVVNFSFVMFWANVYCLWVFFLRNKPGETVSDDTILTFIYTIFSRKFEIDNPDFSPVWNKLGKVEAISVLGIPPLGMPKTLGIWEWGCPKRGDAHITVTPVTAGRREPWDRGWFMISFSIQEIFIIFFIFIYFIYLFFRENWNIGEMQVYNFLTVYL